MQPIGVLLVTQRDGILTDIVRGIVAAEDALALVGEAPEGGELTDDVERTGAEAVVWLSGKRSPSGAVVGLLRRHPRLRVLTVEGDGRCGFLFEMRPHREPIGELSPDRLVGTLRAPASGPAG